MLLSFLHTFTLIFTYTDLHTCTTQKEGMKSDRWEHFARLELSYSSMMNTVGGLLVDCEITQLLVSAWDRSLTVLSEHSADVQTLWAEL